jgi:hypothetical protein
MQQQEKRIVALSVAVTLLGGWVTMGEAAGVGPEVPRTCVTVEDCSNPNAKCAEIHGGVAADWDGACLDIGFCSTETPMSLFCRASS